MLSPIPSKPSRRLQATHPPLPLSLCVSSTCERSNAFARNSPSRDGRAASPIVFFFLQEEARNRDLSWPAPPRLSPQEATCLASPRVASRRLAWPPFAGVEEKNGNAPNPCDRFRSILFSIPLDATQQSDLRLGIGKRGGTGARESQAPAPKKKKKKLIKPPGVFTSSCSSSSASSRLGSSSRSA